MAKEKNKKRVYEDPNIRELRINVPKDLNRKTVNEIINILTAAPAT